MGNKREEPVSVEEASNAFDALKGVATEKNLSYLIIGGHAVLARSYYRLTYDLDIVIQQDHAALWRSAVEEIGYIWSTTTSAFMQFAAPDTNGIGLDLMLVESGTFEKMATNAEELPLGGSLLPVPRSLDIIAMKLHSLHNSHRLEGSSDLQDILALAKHEGFDLTNPEFNATLDRYASDGIKQRIQDELSKR